MKELTYLVRIVRIDERVIDLVETDDFSEAKGIWQKAHEQWTLAVSERRPFLVVEPIVTAFDPSLIREVIVFPIQKQQKTDNPYKAKMQEKGLSAMFESSVYGNVLDQGYK